MAVGGRGGEPLDQADIDAALAAAAAAFDEPKAGAPASEEEAATTAVMGVPAPPAAPILSIFAPISGDEPADENAPNLGIVLDIPLEVSVELGRKRMSIREILDLGSGSIVELDKIAGEPVDLLVNGRLVARGEVVVIEDNFGVRITEIAGDGAAP